LWVPVVACAVEHSYASLVQRSAAWALLQGAGWQPAELAEMACAVAGTGARHEGLMRAATQQLLGAKEAVASRKAAPDLLQACTAVGCPQPELQAFVAATICGSQKRRHTQKMQKLEERWVKAQSRDRAKLTSSS